jgi:hypothetical protein
MLGAMAGAGAGGFLLLPALGLKRSGAFLLRVRGVTGTSRVAGL